MAKMFEVEVEGQHDTVLMQIDGDVDAIRAAVREHLRGTEKILLFEKDHDEELRSIEDRTAIAVVAHCCKKVAVTVRFEHRSETEHFPPSATVFRVLRWAAGKRAFDLDDDARAKANLMLPGADEPLPRDAAIGRYITHGTCAAAFELTLKDFTNG